MDLKPIDSKDAGSRGFTLIEIIMVLVILGIMAAIVMPQMRNTDQDVAEGAARTVAAALEYAQSEAIRRQASVVVSFDSTNHTYSLSDTSGNLLTDPITSQNYVVNLRTLFNNQRTYVGTVNFGSGATSVIFNSLGEPIVASGAPISSSSSIVIGCGSFSYTISVSPVTGKVRFSRNS